MVPVAAHLVPSVPFACCNRHDGEQKVQGLRAVRDRHFLETIHGKCISGVLVGSRSRARGFAAVGRYRENAAADLFDVPENGTTCCTIDIPVTCYQLIGISDRAEKDEIVKSVMQLKDAEIEEGYSMDAVASRQELLTDVRDKLLFEPEYAGNMRDKVPPRASIKIPWTWLPAALCLLQEVGEVNLVLDVGSRVLRHPNAKPHAHDLLLSMALAECAIAKIGLEKNKVSQGFEALARAQALLRSRTSLGKMTLLNQIEESLEELAPACTLEILSMPRLPENSERREGAIAALRELLLQGLDVESSRQVQDWSCFLDQAFNRLMAAEIVHLLPWESLAVTRKNKKSLESQNQRVVVDYNCFYKVLIAHIALGFSSRGRELVSKGKTICECLIASDGIDLKFEEAFCLLLLGKAEEAEAVEKLYQLQMNSRSASQNTLSDKEKKIITSTNQSLELWLRDVVLGAFPDTRDCSPALANYFGGGKRTPLKKEHMGGTRTGFNQLPFNTNSTSEARSIAQPVRSLDSSRHFGPAVRQLAIADLHNPSASCSNSNNVDSSSPSIQLKRNLGVQHDNIWDSWLVSGDVIRKISFTAVLGCLLFGTSRLSSGASWHRLIRQSSSRPVMETSALSFRSGSSLDDRLRSDSLHRNHITRTLKKLLAMIKVPVRNQQEAASMQTSYLAASLSYPEAALSRRPMLTEEAESLVKHWQTIKADALGPSYQTYSLPEVLDESMLNQWQALADAAKERSCFWRFVLLQLSVLRADILIDKTGSESAEIEALLEEAAELVDGSQQKNPNYCSTYKIHYILKRQEDGSWRFCESEIEA